MMVVSCFHIIMFESLQLTSAQFSVHYVYTLYLVAEHSFLSICVYCERLIYLLICESGTTKISPISGFLTIE